MSTRSECEPVSSGQIDTEPRGFEVSTEHPSRYDDGLERARALLADLENIESQDRVTRLLAELELR